MTYIFLLRTRLRRHVLALAARLPHLRRARDTAPTELCAFDSPLTQEPPAETTDGGFLKMTPTSSSTGGLFVCMS